MRISFGKSIERYKEAARIAQIGCWEFDFLRNELWWSEEIYDILELNSHQFRPSLKNYIEIIHPDDRNNFNQAYSTSLKFNNPFSDIHQVLLCEGRTKYIHYLCQTRYNAVGQPIKSWGTLQDISQIRNLQLEIEKSHRNFANIVQESPEGMIICDENGIINCFNNKAEEIYGLSEKDALLKNINEFVPLDKQGILNQFIQEFKLHKASESLVIQLDGSTTQKTVNGDLILKPVESISPHQIIALIRETK